MAVMVKCATKGCERLVFRGICHECWLKKRDKRLKRLQK